MTGNNTNYDTFPRSSRGRVLRPVGQWWITAPPRTPHQSVRQTSKPRRSSERQNLSQRLHTSYTRTTASTSLPPPFRPPTAPFSSDPISELARDSGSLSLTAQSSSTPPSSPVVLPSKKTTPQLSPLPLLIQSPPLAPSLLRLPSSLLSPSLSPSPSASLSPSSSSSPSSPPSPPPSLSLSRLLTKSVNGGFAHNYSNKVAKSLPTMAVRKFYIAGSTEESQNILDSHALPPHACRHTGSSESITTDNIEQIFCSRCSQLGLSDSKTPRDMEGCIRRSKNGQVQDNDSESLISFKS